MRWMITTSSLMTALALLLAGCPEDTGDPPPVFNNLPEIRAALNDGDPLTDGATINLEISDQDGEQCALTVEFSLDDGETYTPASVPMITGGNLHELSCPESGEDYTMVWDTDADLGGELATRALLRFQVEDAEDPGPPSHLMVPLVVTEVVVAGDYVVRPNAQGAQWAWIQMFLVHMEMAGGDVQYTGNYLDGGDTFINNGDPPHSWSYKLPTPPPEEHFQAIDNPEQGKEGDIALYIPTAFRDEDISGDFAPGDPLLGAPVRQLVAFVRPEGAWIEEGWHVLEFGAVDADAPLSFEPIETPVGLMLKAYPVESGEVTLDISMPTTDAQPRRCGAMPWFEGTQIPSNNYEMTSILFDPIPATMKMAVDAGWIKGSHWAEENHWPNFAEGYAEEVFYLYRDLDGDEQASHQEPVTHLGLHQPEAMPLSLIYFDGEMDFDNLFLWTVDDCWLGFNLVTWPEEVIPEPPEDPYYRHACHPLAPGLTIEFLAP